MKFLILIVALFVLIIQNKTIGQSKEIESNFQLFAHGEFDKLEKQLLYQTQNRWDFRPKKDKIQIYTDLGKVYIIKNNNAEALNYLIKAEQLNVGDSSKFGVYYSAYADLFNRIGAYDLAIEFYKKSYNRSKSKLESYFNANSIGGMFLNINKPDSALVYFKNQRIESEKMNDHIALSSSINNIGIAYMKKADFKNAVLSFEQALSIMKRNTSNVSKYFQNEKASFTNNVLGNLGASYFELKEYSKAIYFLDQFHTNNLSEGKNPSRGKYENLLVCAFLEKGEINNAKKIENYYNRKKQYLTTDGNLDLLFMQLEIANYEKNNLKIGEIIKRIKELEEIKSSEKSISFNEMNKLVSHFMLSQADQEIKFEKRKKLQMNKMLIISKRESTLGWLLLLSGTFIIVIVFYFLNQRRKNQMKKDQLEKDFLLLEEAKLKFKISKQDNYLTEFALENEQQKKQSKELLKNLNYLMSLDEENIKNEIKNLILDLKNKQLSEKRVEELNEKSEQLLFDFKANLLFKHQNLSSSDIELCSLIKLNLSNKEIAHYKNITNESVKIYKNRLKNKLCLENSQSLNDYIISF